ncbi:MAG: PQQ-binding-like beta-propeller repeat protein, partial [Armatimonadota bacterium]
GEHPDHSSKARQLVTTERDGQVLIDPADQHRANWIAWGGDPATEGEQHMLQAHPRVQVDPANYRELGIFREPVMTEDAMYYSRPADHRLIGEARGGHLPEHVEYAEVVAYDITEPNWGYTVTTYVRCIVWPTAQFREMWRLESDLKVHLKAGRRLYGGARGAVGAIDIPDAGEEPAETWRAEIEGTPGAMLACDGRLITVTEQGRIYCFGPGETEPQHHEAPEITLPPGDDRWSVDIERMLRGTSDQDYCVVVGPGGYEVVDELLRQSELHVIVLDAREAAADEARRRYDGRGVYGSRVHIIPASIDSQTLSPYFANLVVCADPDDAGLLGNTGAMETVSRWLRPYGGSAWIATSAGEHPTLTSLTDETEADGVEVRRRGDFTVLRRDGELPNSAGWTHESGSATNTFASEDLRVRLPLGVLWFGGTVDEIFPPWDYTHKRGPMPVICEGRMFILVANMLHAVDAYTGQLLWSVSLEETEKAMRRKHHHMRKQRAWAENFVATPDILYVVGNGTCVQISAISGERLGELVIPEGVGENATWREVYVSGDHLVGTAADQVVCINRHSGEELWRFGSEQDTFHLAMDDDTVFCVDYWLPDRLRRGDVRTEPSTITALDLGSGHVRWQHRLDYPINPAEEMTGDGTAPLEPYLQYCAEQDALLLTLNRSQSVSYGITYGDRPATVAGFRGEDGEQLWAGHVPCRDVHSQYSGPELPILLSDRFITHAGQVFDPMTGEEKTQRLWVGMNANSSGPPGEGLRGCNRAVGCPNLATVRDSIASYFDVATGEQGFFAGIRSGCTNSLIPADGIINAPNLSHGCACNTPVFVSSAFVHMPEAAEWQSELRSDRTYASVPAGPH